MMDPHPVSCLEVQHCQVGSCFVSLPDIIKRHCHDLWCTVQHNVCINGLSIITLDIDKEDVHPRQGRSEYPVTRVVAVAHVGDDIGEYQGTAVPCSTDKRHTSCECYPVRHIYKKLMIRTKLICDPFILLLTYSGILLSPTCKRVYVNMQLIILT